MSDTIKAPPANDGCPVWASELIAKILVLEVEAGTIKSPNSDKHMEGWSTSQVDELMKAASRLDETDQTMVENPSSSVETLFSKVTRGLKREGLSDVEIAAMINARIPTGCRLPYCSADEVRAAWD